jgi:hypothetical protein
METMRELLLRVQRDPAFADQVRVDPEAAAAGYDITDEELESLRHPGVALYRRLIPAHRLRGEGVLGELPPPNEGNPFDTPYPNHIEVPEIIDPDLYNDLPMNDLPIVGKQVFLDEAERLELIDEIRASVGPVRRAKLEEFLEYL